MQSIIIISEQQNIEKVFKFDLLDSIKKRYKLGENGYVIEFYNQNYIILTKDNRIINEFDEDEISKIKLAKPNFFLLEYKNFEHFRSIMPILFKELNLWCDLEDNIISATDIIKALYSNHKWDWRKI